MLPLRVLVMADGRRGGVLTLRRATEPGGGGNRGRDRGQLAACMKIS